MAAVFNAVAKRKAKHSVEDEEVDVDMHDIGAVDDDFSDISDSDEEEEEEEDEDEGEDNADGDEDGSESDASSTSDQKRSNGTSEHRVQSKAKLNSGLMPKTRVLMLTSRGVSSRCVAFLFLLPFTFYLLPFTILSIQ